MHLAPDRPNYIKELLKLVSPLEANNVYLLVYRAWSREGSHTLLRVSNVPYMYSLPLPYASGYYTWVFAFTRDSLKVLITHKAKNDTNINLY